MKRLILLLAVPVMLIAAHAMGGSSSDVNAAAEVANPCEICCPEVICTDEVCPDECCPEDCCIMDCCPLDALVSEDCDSCPGAQLLGAAAEKLSEAGSAVASFLHDR